jgi:hypothetical protein
VVFDLGGFLIDWDARQESGRIAGGIVALGPLSPGAPRCLMCMNDG